MDFREIEIFEVIADLYTKAEFSEGVSLKIREMRKESVLQLLPHALSFFNRGYRLDIILTIIRKKGNFILGATTKQEITDIMKPSLTYYNYQELVPKTPYHIEEEELLLMMEAISSCQLNELAINRIFTLYRKIFPEGLYYATE